MCSERFSFLKYSWIATVKVKIRWTKLGTASKGEKIKTPIGCSNSGCNSFVLKIALLEFDRESKKVEPLFELICKTSRIQSKLKTRTQPSNFGTQSLSRTETFEYHSHNPRKCTKRLLRLLQLFSVLKPYGTESLCCFVSSKRP